MTMELKRDISVWRISLCVFQSWIHWFFLRINMLGFVLIIKNFAAENCKRLLQWVDSIYSVFLNWISLAWTHILNIPFSLALNGHIIHGLKRLHGLLHHIKAVVTSGRFDICFLFQVRALEMSPRDWYVVRSKRGKVQALEKVRFDPSERPLVGISN